MNDKFKIVGKWLIRRIDNHTGKVIDEISGCNLIVNDGLERIAKLLTKGVASTAYGYIAIGTGTNVAQASDTELQTEITRAEADDAGGSYEADYKCKFEKTFVFSSGESYSITESGIFDSLTETGSNMLNRYKFDGRQVDSDIDLFVRCQITISRP